MIVVSSYGYPVKVLGSDVILHPGVPTELPDELLPALKANAALDIIETPAAVESDEAPAEPELPGLFDN